MRFVKVVREDEGLGVKEEVKEMKISVEIKGKCEVIEGRIDEKEM